MNKRSQLVKVSAWLTAEQVAWLRSQHRKLGTAVRLAVEQAGAPPAGHLPQGFAVASVKRKAVATIKKRLAAKNWKFLRLLA